MEPLVAPDAGFGQTISALKRVQKSGRNAPAYSRWINRRLGRILAALAFRAGLTPNQVTLISACFTFAGVVSIALLAPSAWAGAVIAALLILGYALDSADGQLARLRGGGSPAGEWLDHVVDAIKASAWHAAVTIAWLHYLGDWPLWTIVIPLGFGVVASSYFFGMIQTDLLLRNSSVGSEIIDSQETKAPIVGSILALVNDYGLLCVSMLFFGWFDLWRTGYAVLAIGNALLLAVQLVRWYRRFRAT